MLFQVHQRAGGVCKRRKTTLLSASQPATAMLMMPLWLDGIEYF